MDNTLAESTIKKHQNKTTQKLIKKTNMPYKKCISKIIAIDKWINPNKNPDPLSKRFPSSWIQYNYSGISCLYQKQEHISGPRLDVDLVIKLNNETLKVTLNIYDEIMELTGYLKMSYKLSESIRQNEGKEIEIILFENGDIGIDVRTLLSFNYGYKGKV